PTHYSHPQSPRTPPPAPIPSAGHTTPTCRSSTGSPDSPHNWGRDVPPSSPPAPAHPRSRPPPSRPPARAPDNSGSPRCTQAPLSLPAPHAPPPSATPNPHLPNTPPAPTATASSIGATSQAVKRRHRS